MFPSSHSSGGSITEFPQETNWEQSEGLLASPPVHTQVGSGPVQSGLHLVPAGVVSKSSQISFPTFQPSSHFGAH